MNYQLHVISSYKFNLLSLWVSGGPCDFTMILFHVMQLKTRVEEKPRVILQPKDRQTQQKGKLHFASNFLAEICRSWKATGVLLLQKEGIYVNLPYQELWAPWCCLGGFRINPGGFLSQWNCNWQEPNTKREGLFPQTCPPTVLKAQNRKTALLLIPQPEAPHGYEDTQEELNLEFWAQIAELNECIYLVAEIVRRTEFHSIKFCLKHELSSEGPQKNQACLQSCFDVHAGSQQLSKNP